MTRLALPQRHQPPGMPLANKRVGVFGMARSGLAAGKFLQAKGAQAVVFDQKPPDALAAQIAELEAAGVQAKAGVTGYEDVAGLDALVVSPGVPVDHPILQQARAAGVEVISEIELAWRSCPAPMVAVAGTNGKGSSTTMLGGMLQAAGLRVVVAGNIGTPLVSVVEGDWDVVVAEVSSFQLETIADFHPWAAILLNITPDHLDRHGTFDGYVAAKARLFMNMGPNDVAVVNVDDEAARGVADTLSLNVLRVTAAAPACNVSGRGFQPRPERRYDTESGLEGPPTRCVNTTATAWLDGDNLMVKLPGEADAVAVCERHDLPLKAPHYLGNALCAAVVARAAGCAPEAIRAGVRAWQPVDHQLRQVAEIGGICFVDDSKATNPASAIADLDTIEGPVVVIAGGLTKGLSMEAFGEALARRAKAVFLIGAGAEEIAAAVADRVPVTITNDIEAAVRAAHQAAEAGDTVVLAPACASFDQFAGQAQRGERFAAAARSLKTP